MRSIVAAIAAVLVAGTVLAPGAVAQDRPKLSSQVIVSGPGEGFAGRTYLTPAAVAEPGAELTYVNLDIASHDVRSDDPGPDTQPWCSQLNFPAGRCPLFFTGLIGLGQTTPVLGLENLEPGRNYDFHCSLHSWMKGTLVVPPSV